jgi:hypothetical protein
MHLVTSDEPRNFVQVWPSETTGEWVVREGTLGRAGKVRETGLSAKTTPIEQVVASYQAKGFVEVDEHDYDYVVVQFPTRSSAFDRRHIVHVTEWLDAYLDERGLGYVDGHDRGKRVSDGKIVVNIFAWALDGELGSVTAMAALRKGAADPTRATIAYRSAGDDDWVLRYERTAGKLPGSFSL